MTPDEIIHDATADGVLLTLSASETVKLSGERAAVERWVTLIREHKPEVVAALKDQVRSRNWRIAISGRCDFEVIVTPPTTITEMRVLYPNAESVLAIAVP